MKYTKMAENSKGGILNKAEKILRRRKTKVLQSLGKQGRTTDEILAEDCQKLDKQQEVANKFQKDLRSYIHCARALSVASKTFYTTVSEAYEPEWENHAQITEILTNMDMLWQDYLQKLQEQALEPLTKYLATIPQIKSRVAKRGRKLIDYDNAKHGLEVQQNAKKKDDTKIAKAQDDLEQAKKIYEDLNNELHHELPEFYNSRVKFYGNLFQGLFTAENVFQTEAGKGTDIIVQSADQLSKDNEHFTYTPRKSLRNTVVIGSDENLTDGHPENNHESRQQDSPSSSSPSSPTSPVANATVNLTNGNNEADTSKESIDAYETTAFQQTESKVESNNDEVKVDAKVDAKVEATVDNVEVVADKLADDVDDKPEQVEEKPSVIEQDQVEEKVVEVVTETVTETVQDKVESKRDSVEVKVNGDLDSSVEQEVPVEAPPPVPATLPPDEDKSKVDANDDKKADKDNNDNDDDDMEQTEGVDDDNLYQVPPPAKPVDDDLPPKYLYTDDIESDSDDDDKPDNFLYKVVATHAYKGEDEDELSFDAQEVIYVVQYDDPDEQDPGWLMGIRKTCRQVGVFPENFTKKV